MSRESLTPCKRAANPRRGRDRRNLLSGVRFLRRAASVMAAETSSFTQIGGRGSRRRGRRSFYDPWNHDDDDDDDEERVRADIVS